MKVVLKILLWVAIIAAVILLTWFLATKIGQFATMWDCLDYVVARVREAFS